MPDILVVNAVFFIIGLLIILKGSDLFLDSAVWIASASGVPQIIIGATIVSLCTTTPELVSSVTAAMRGASDMALGNAVGSVICNTGFILGLLLVLMPLTVRREIYMIKGIFMLGALVTGLLLILPGAADEGVYQISRAEGGILLVILVTYLVVNYYESLHAGPPPGPESLPKDPAVAPIRKDWLRHGMLFLGGAVLVAVGAWLLVEFGQKIARGLGVKEAVVSLLFIALGTSLPELFTAISAVRKKAEQISIGNIFGANVLNLAMVTGVSALIDPLRVEDVQLGRIDIPVALAICATIYVIGLIRGKLGRYSGALLLLLYVCYIGSMFSMNRI